MNEKIIDFLRTSPTYVSGEELSRRLKISRAGIWKNIQEFRKQGYEIVAVPHLGYRLVTCPDKLIPREIKNGLKSEILGREILCFDTLESTMDEAFSLGVKGAVEGTVVCAENQSKGRGRLGRRWVSPKGKGIYVSIILRPSLAPSEVSKLTLVCAVAVAEAIHTQTQICPRIKWPNDLLVEGRKLAGILTELSAETDRVRFVVVGMGINVNTPASSVPEGSTSLKHIAHKQFSRVALLQEILCSFEQWYHVFQSEGFSPVMHRWKDLSATIGRKIRISEPRGVEEGEAIDLDEDGGLLIRMPSGEIYKKMAGDVVLIES